MFFFPNLMLAQMMCPSNVEDPFVPMGLNAICSPPALITSLTTTFNIFTPWTSRGSPSLALLAPKNWQTNMSRSVILRQKNYITDYSVISIYIVLNLFVQDFNSGLFLARGHLAPNADFIFYSLMVNLKINF